MEGSLLLAKTTFLYYGVIVILDAYHLLSYAIIESSNAENVFVFQSNNGPKTFHAALGV